MQNRHNILAIAALLATSILLFHCDKGSSPVSSNGDVANTNFTATKDFSFDVDATNLSRLRLEAIDGDIIVTGTTGSNSVIITGERQVGSESVDDAEAHLDELEVSVSDLGEEIVVRTTQPTETHGRSYIVDYNIRLPRGMEVLCTGVSGTASIDSISNSVSADMVNGQLSLEDIFGSTSVDLTNGQINATITLPLDGTIDMTMVNGNIQLGIPLSTSAAFSASLVSGIISISPDLDLQDMNQTANSLTGTLGDGRGTITLSTTNGNIEVTGF
jgi:hypothetical protein